MSSLPTGTVTFLFTDIDGSTALLQRLGDRRYAEVLAEHQRLLRDAFAEGNGHEVDTQGDAFLVAFPRARDALATAVAAQRALMRHPWPDGASLRVRMGLHTGEPVAGGAGYVGMDLHRAARIAAAGHGGQILLSDAVSGLAARDLPAGARLRDLGTHRLKDLKESEHLFQIVHPDLPADFPPLKSLEALPKTTAARTKPLGQRAWALAVTLIVIAIATAGIWRAGLIPVTQMTRPTTAGAPRLSIVVLPFANLGKETDQSFADAIVQDLTTDLSRISESFVIAWSTAAGYKGKAIDLKQLGRDLGVRYVLEGSVERAANHVRINAQLIDAGTGYHLWAEGFDRALGDLLTIQDEITKRIAYTLRLQLIRVEAERAERNRTNPEAMDYVMRGRAMSMRPPSRENFRQTQEMFEQALLSDNRLPAAQTGLAGTLVSEVLYLLSDAPEADLRRADDLVSKVLAVDPNDSGAHYVKAQILRAQAMALGMTDRFQHSIAEYETVIALDPNNASALSNEARSKILIGLPGEAIPLLEKSLRISPHDPSISLVQYRLGLAHQLLGHTDEAIQWYRKASTAYPIPEDLYAHLGAALALKGDKAAAQAALAEAARINPKYTTIANIRQGKADTPISMDPRWRALEEQTIIKGLRQAGVPEQ